MPGKKDCKSVRMPGRIMIQKTYTYEFTLNLTVIQDKYSDIKVGFSKFAELRPPHCFLVGASGTHSVCVYTIHQKM